MLPNYLTALTAAFFLSTGIATAHAGEKPSALGAAITCYNASSAIADHTEALRRRPSYVPERKWNPAMCDLALLISKKSGSAALTVALTAFSASLKPVAADVDAVVVAMKTSSAWTDSHAAREKLSATLDAYIPLRAALAQQIRKEKTEADRKQLSALAKKEKRKKVKSAIYYSLAISIGEEDLRTALANKDYVAFSKPLPIIYDAVTALATGPEGELLADYCAAVLQLHKAASAVTPTWGSAELIAFSEAQQAVVAASNAL